MKENILIITTKLNNGGAERNVALLSNRLKKDYNVFVVVFNNTNQEYKMEVPIIDLQTPNTNKIIKKIYYTLVRIKKIKAIKNKYNIACSISFLTGPNLVNVLTKKNEKVIISIRNYISKSCKNVFGIFSNKIACKKADKIVCVSEMVKKDQIENFGVDANKLVTIYNYYEKGLREENVIPKDSKYESDFITVGRLHNQKGQWHLIKAFKEVVKVYPNSKLKIFGRGKLEKYLQKIIKNNGLEKNVELCGYKVEISEYLRNSKAFVLPSIYEGCPNVVLEAMGHGLPIIATDCFGGNREILEPSLETLDYIKETRYGKFGILVPNMGKTKTQKITRNEAELAKVLIDVLNNEKLRKEYQKKSENRLKFFNSEKNLQEWKKIIQEK